MESSAVIFKLTIEPLIGEIKHVFRGENELEYRDKSKGVALLEVFRDYQYSDAKTKIDFFQLKGLPRVWCEKFEPCVFEQKWVGSSRNFSTNCALCFFLNFVSKLILYFTPPPGVGRRAKKHTTKKLKGNINFSPILFNFFLENSELFSAF